MERAKVYHIHVIVCVALITDLDPSRLTILQMNVASKILRVHNATFVSQPVALSHINWYLDITMKSNGHCMKNVQGHASISI